MRRKKPTDASRMMIYLPPEDRKIWEQALAMGDHESYSAMVRDLVRKYHKRMVRRAARICGH